MINFDVNILTGRDKTNGDYVEVHFKGSVIVINVGLLVEYEYFVVDGNLVVTKCEYFKILRVKPVETIGDVVNGILESLNG